jgi:hypothetical protein
VCAVCACGVGADGMKDEGREFEGGEGGTGAQLREREGMSSPLGEPDLGPPFAPCARQQSKHRDVMGRTGTDLNYAVCCVPHVTARSSELKRAPIGVCGVQEIDEPWRERA